LKRFKLTYYLLIYLSIVLSSCSTSKNSLTTDYLLTKSSVKIKGNKQFETQSAELIRQNPNTKILGLPILKWIYNSVDSSYAQKKKAVTVMKMAKSNVRLLEKQKRINEKRIKRAREKGENYYDFKNITLKDTANPKKSLLEWLKFRIGEQPVIFDSIYFIKSIDQLKLFYKKKGFYDALVRGEVHYFSKQKKAHVKYDIETGSLYTIDSIVIESKNRVINDGVNRFLSDAGLSKVKKGSPFDSDAFLTIREDIATAIKNEGGYGFKASNIRFEVDTSIISKKVFITVQFTERAFFDKIKDSIRLIPFEKVLIKNVFFHLCDTAYTTSSHKERTMLYRKPLLTDGFISTLDTLYFSKGNVTSIYDSSGFTITYNTKLALNPTVFESSNGTLKSHFFNQISYEKTLRNLIELNVFQVVKPLIDEVSDREIEIHYYLVPKKKGLFNLEPKFTTSGVFLGVSGLVSYTNTNLFKKSERLTLSFSGGFQSMPQLEIINNNNSSDVAVKENVKQVFNTFDIGPSLKLDLPGFFPFFREKNYYNTHARTLISTNFGYQKRNVFDKQSFKLNFSYSFSFSENHQFEVGLPGFSSVNFVNYQDFNESFKNNLGLNNDPFTKNYYSNLLNWEDLSFHYQYANLLSAKSNTILSFKSGLNLAGNFLSLFKSIQSVNSDNLKMFISIPYSQFIRVDNEFIVNQMITKEKSIHFKFLAGAGMPYQNSRFSLPFDYSFFGGGPNDIRAWRAGTLGPGGYNYYLDKNYTTVQLADIRLGISAEYRMRLSSLFKGALFIDAGNIWTSKVDPTRKGSVFSPSFYKEIAIAGGVGLRADFDYIILRVDMGLKLRNPAMSEGYRWFFNPKDPAVEEVLSLGKFTSPFLPRNWNDLFNTLRIGIGYPF
jgi:outer membrane protein insertion porin family